MESIIQQLGSLDILPVFSNLFFDIAQPFVHSFQSVAPKFLPQLKSLIINDPGLIGGMIFVLFSYASFLLFQRLKKERVFITSRKPSAVYREGFPNRLNRNQIG